MSNQTTNTATGGTGRVMTDKVGNIIGNNDGSKFNIKQVFNQTGATQEQLDDILMMMQKQVETANIHAKIIAKLLNLDI